MWKVILSIMGIVFLAAGCNESTEVQQIAFRVQPSFSAAAALNENVTVSADQPFRISFEIAPTTTDSLHLQYRRNKGEWIDLDQADFPYPESASPRVSIVSPGTQQQVDNQWEWPLVIRRFADGAVTNNEGDVFAFRLITPDGIPVNSDATPELTLSVEEGHLGGTFVETPGRIGPWQAANGDLYFIMEPSETDNVLMMVKSNDEGRTWTEVDGANRPAADDLEGVASVQSEGVIHILHQTSDNVWYHAFNTSDHPSSPDTWSTTDEEAAAPAEPPTQVAAIAARSDGSLLGVYGGPEKIHYRIRTIDGNWTSETILDANDAIIYSGPQIATDASDAVHLAYTGNDGSAWHRIIEPDGTPSERELLTRGIGTTEYDVGAILPLVYLDESNTVVTLYRLESGLLWERRKKNSEPMSEPVQVSDRLVVQNAVDSDQVGADAISFQEKVYVLFIEQGTGSIYATHSDETGTWQPPTLQIDNIQAQWLRGALHAHTDDTHTYAYIYDAGSNGGSGMNKFDQIHLD